MTPTVPAGLRAALLLTLAGAAVAGVVGALVDGSAAAWGVLLGALVLVGFFVGGTLTTHAVATVAPTLSLLVALLTYTLQVVVLGLLFVGLQRSGLLEDAVDRRWLGGTVVVGTLGWTWALVVAATRQRIPHYHTPSDLAKSREGASSEAQEGDPTPG